MLDYHAPLAEMKFVIKNLIGLESLVSLYGNDEFTEETLEVILTEAEKFAKHKLNPINFAGDREGCHLEKGVVSTAKGWRDAYSFFVEGGWQGLSVSEEFGGQGLPKIVSSAVSEMWDSTNMSFALCPLLTSGAIDAIEAHGCSRLKQLYLHRLVSGEWTGTMNLTEPQSGSDLSKVKTQAIPYSDHYKIKGQKIYITYGDHDLTENIIHLVLARLPGAPEGTHGISLFLVPKIILDSNGELSRPNDLKCLSLENKLGIHASPTAVMQFGDNEGAVGYLIGEENKGLSYMFTMMNNARHAVGREGLALSEAAYQLAKDYSLSRIQGKVPKVAISNTIVEHQDVKRMLLEIKATTEAMRALVYYCAHLLDVAEKENNQNERAVAQNRADFLTPVVKAWCTDNAQHITSLALQIHGGMGFIEETGIAQYVRDARILTIYEGTNGIQALDLLWRKTIKDNFSAADDFVAEIEKFAHQDLSKAGFLNLQNAILESLKDLKDVIDWLKKNKKNKEICNSAATHYLKLFGLVFGAWMMFRSAKLMESEDDKDPEKATVSFKKMKTAEFYAAQILPSTKSLRQKIVDGSEVIEQIDSRVFL
ncbi:MAG: acyl-CoA dehydrogenase [Pseudomonadota bacterium]|nr:acyl-CoA dehydrogenase [Pseudomonadota bacterium]